MRMMNVHAYGACVWHVNVHADGHVHGRARARARAW